MWVRSQEGEKLLNVNGVYFGKSNKGYVVRCLSGNVDYKLGEYSSKEKALKVLNMVQEYILQVYDYIFQMPSDDEVE